MTAVLVLSAVALVGLAAAAALAVLRRRQPDGSGWSWRESPAEPWGSIVLVVFFLFPVAAAIGRAVSVGWLAIPLLAAAVVWAWVRVGGSNMLRSVTVSPDSIEWRTILRTRRRAPLTEVVAVTDPHLTGEAQSRIRFSDGTEISLPGNDEALSLAANLASLIGQPWPPRIGRD